MILNAFFRQYHIPSEQFIDRLERLAQAYRPIKGYFPPEFFKEGQAALFLYEWRAEDHQKRTYYVDDSGCLFAEERL